MLKSWNVEESSCLWSVWAYGRIGVDKAMQGARMKGSPEDSAMEKNVEALESKRSE